MAKKLDDIILKFDKEIQSLELEPEVYSQGKILTLGDGIATVSGLADVMYNELVQLPQGIKGLAFNLEEEKVGLIILGDYKKLKEGDLAVSTGRIMEVPASEDFLGRVINPLGESLDGKGEIKPKKIMPIEKIAPGVVRRQSVDTSLQTGIKAIDSMIPIGRGQRELIIGDRGTGKTSIVIDTIINQKGGDVVCIYVAIGQKGVRVARIQEKLTEVGAMDHTIIVAANASDPSSLQYIAPYAGCAIGEYFMEKGRDVLIVYDDLTKHSWAYRQLSLLLKRPSGREAFPGDIFYLHSRLLERSCRIADKYGGGSLTALPIIETQAGDVSAYIPTNVISITDGQIYLEPDLFFAGIRPAVNVGLSVSRVGGEAQIKAMKKVASQLRLELAQYRELVTFTQFTTDLDPETKKKVDRGTRISEIFKQPQHAPQPVEKQVAIIWAVTRGYLDNVPLKLIKDFEREFLDYLEKPKLKILNQIREVKDLSPKLEDQLIKTIELFKKDFNSKYRLEVKENAQRTETNQEESQVS